MTLQFGPTKIGGMQYNGVTISEAMYNGQIVYRSVITVTPQSPTFLTASPWYTLPTQAGVTYTVSGTPGYSQTVTITATPQAGYALAGQTSWTHTYPSFYPTSGTWGPTNLSSSYSIYATHTIVESGTFTITHTVRAESGLGRSATARISGPWGNTTGTTASGGGTSTASTSRVLPSGAVVEFRAAGNGNNTGSWSIVKN